MHLQDPAYQKVQSFGFGRGKVVLQDKKKKISNELFSSDFVKPDPSDRLIAQQCRQLTELLSSLCKDGHLDPGECKLLIPSQPYSGSLPKFYGLPKIHKIGLLKIRPIISTSGFFADKLMLKMKLILNLLIWGTTTE